MLPLQIPGGPELLVIALIFGVPLALMVAVAVLVYKYFGAKKAEVEA